MGRAAVTQCGASIQGGDTVRTLMREFRAALCLGVVLAMTAQASAGPLGFLYDGRSDNEAPQTAAVAAPDPASDSKAWYKKWFGGTHERPVAQFTQPQSNASAAFAYQTPATTASSAPRVALNSQATVTPRTAPIPSLPARKEASKETTRAVVEQSQMLEARGQIDAARQTLVSHLTQHSFDVRALRALGHLEDRAGNLAQAETHYRQALGADPMSAPSMNDLGLCLARQSRLEEAQAALNEAIRLMPNKALYRNNAATLLVEIGEDGLALEQLKSVYPPATASFNLGQLLARAGRVDEAIDSYRLALELDPGHPAALSALSKHNAGAKTGAPVEQDNPPIEVIGPIEAEDPIEADGEFAQTQSFPRLLPPIIDR